MTNQEIVNEIKCLLSELNNGEDAVSYLTQNDMKWLNENIKALEQEPTTKNDDLSDCISRKFMRDLGATCIAYRNDKQELIPIISIDELPSVTPQLSSGLEKNSKKLEKDFGELDCIDRAELLKAMDTWDKFGDDPNEGLIPLRTPALQDRYVPYVKYDDMVNCVKSMSSVTPQEPRWIPVSEKLPENKETVLVTFKHFVSGNTIGLGSVILLRGKPHWHVREQNLGTYDVLAWMPLPKGYGEVEE